MKQNYRSNLWKYVSYNEDTNTALDVIISEQSIIDKYYKQWESNAILRDEPDISYERFIDEWREAHFAWRIDENKNLEV